MAEQFVDLAYVDVVHSGGSARLLNVTSISVDVDDPAEPVKTMNPARRARGYRRGVPDFTISLEYAQKIGDDEVPWEAMRRNRETFLIVIEEGEGGRRVQYRDCIVSSSSKSYDEGGGTSTSVEIIALDEKEE